MPEVLVVTPAFCSVNNLRLPLLLQTIQSIRQQTHRDYLHVVVDDGSTDNAAEVLEETSQDDPRLSVFRKKNGGYSAAINFGVRQVGTTCFLRPALKLRMN